MILQFASFFSQMDYLVDLQKGPFVKLKDNGRIFGIQPYEYMGILWIWEATFPALENNCFA